MKKLAFIPVLIALFQVVSYTQILDKGNFMIGSTVGFSTANSKVTSGDEEGEGLTARQFNIAPAIGYFVVDNLALGLGADFTFNKVKEPNEDETNDSDLLFGPFVRYYMPLGSNVAFFLVTNFGFGSSTDEQIIGENKQSIKQNIFAIGAGPGLTVYSDGGFGIEAIFKYNYANSKFDTETGGITTSTTTRTNQFSLSLGMQYYFGGLRRARG